MKRSTKNLVFTALCIAIGLLLPSVFHLFGAGSQLLPMHLPVLLCGFLCGVPYGAFCGLVTPLLSSLLTQMPPLFPTAPAMMLELCTYGALTGLFYQKLRRNVYPSLIAAMLGGRIVSGLANAAFMGMSGAAYGFEMFLTASFVTALPGILIQIVVLPLLVLALQKAGFLSHSGLRAAH